MYLCLFVSLRRFRNTGAQTLPQTDYTRTSGRVAWEPMYLKKFLRCFQCKAKATRYQLQILKTSISAFQNKGAGLLVLLLRLERQGKKKKIDCRGVKIEEGIRSLKSNYIQSLEKEYDGRIMRKRIHVYVCV